MAGHLLKAVHFWTDIGLGDFELRFLRDKLVVRDRSPVRVPVTTLLTQLV